tara:strand:+ start:1616 stop:1849 length:234 start_codon:yes stop_codon:yes gene_type:complete
MLVTCQYAFSVPISIWGDVSTADDVYKALRQENTNYTDMTNTKIWLKTLFMPSESLVGLTPLTKGARVSLFKEPLVH